MSLMWDHSRVAYGRTVKLSNPDGSTRAATPVKFDGVAVGFVARAEVEANGWGYRAADGGFVVGFRSRAEAADHLLSARSPSAAWLS